VWGGDWGWGWRVVGGVGCGGRFWTGGGVWEWVEWGVGGAGVGWDGLGGGGGVCRVGTGGVYDEVGWMRGDVVMG